jgi:hypothetical protein
MECPFRLELFVHVWQLARQWYGPWIGRLGHVGRRVHGFHVCGSQRQWRSDRLSKMEYSKRTIHERHGTFTISSFVRFCVIMVHSCSSSYHLQFARSQDVTGDGLRAWDVSNVRNMDDMFYLELPTLAGVDATDQYITEYNGPSFAGDLSGWNVSSLRSANRMFHGNVNYHRSLCWWKLWLQDDVSTVDMFQGTNCATLDDPDQTGYCTLCDVCAADGCIPKQPKETGGIPLSIVGRNLCMTTNYRFHFEGERVVGYSISCSDPSA